jgi:hypothetical protein
MTTPEPSPRRLVWSGGALVALDNDGEMTTPTDAELQDYQAAFYGGAVGCGCGDPGNTPDCDGCGPNSPRPL